MTTRHFASALGALALMASSAFAVNITVAPATGTLGLNPTTTIADALAQINAAPIGSHTVTLRSTEGNHSQPDNTTWTVSAEHDVSFVAESGRPIVQINHAAGQYMLIVSAQASADVTFNGLGFIPENDLGYTNNVADGISLAGTGAASNFTFIDCIFAANDGSGGLSSLDGSAPFVQPTGAPSPSVGGRNVGDDWIQLNKAGSDLTVSNCVVTGCNDDGILSLGGAGSIITINQGTVVANIGGGGYQNAADNETIVIDGSGGRVLFANCGLRTAVSSAADTGPKCFGDLGVSFTMSQADVCNATNGGIFFFGAVPSITISDSRIALNNSSNTNTAANLAIDDITGTGGAVNQIVNLSRVTVHDTLATTNSDSIFGGEGVNDGRQTYTIIDSIFSGAGDRFTNMTNSTASGGPSPAPAVTFSAIVLNGPHGILPANVGDLGSAVAPLPNDPNYVSLTYTICRSQSNPSFLLPQNPPYATANSTSGPLVGGSPGTFVSLPMELSILSTN